LNKNVQPAHRKYGQLLDVELYSTQDIRGYQACPDWPMSTKSGFGSLPLRGKADIHEVMKYFQALRKECKPLLKGCVLLPQE
jgi:hypothetical protein